MTLKWKFVVRFICVRKVKQKKNKTLSVFCIELTVVHQKINQNLETLAEPVDLILQ